MSSMKKLSNTIEHLISELSGDSDQARINLRAHQVRDRYRKALQTVYPQTFQLFLDHTNNVYILKDEGVKTLIVYVDESIFAAELNAQRELIKLKLLELFGEQIEEFRIHVSRAQYKNYHPYTIEEDALKTQAPPLAPLDESEKRYVKETASIVEDDKLRESFEKAMTADVSRKRAQNGSVK